MHIYLTASFVELKEKEYSRASGLLLPVKMSGGSNHAIVYGASGLIGWALVDQLLSLYPQAGTFSKVTAITNRPLDLSETYWPKSDLHLPELQFVSGIDLRHGDGATLAKSLKQVKDVENVTHVYYLGMSPSRHTCIIKLTIKSLHRARR